MKFSFHTESEIFEIVPVGYVSSPETIEFTVFTGKLSHALEGSPLMLRFYKQRIQSFWPCVEGEMCWSKDRTTSDCFLLALSFLFKRWTNKHHGARSSDPWRFWSSFPRDSDVANKCPSFLNRKPQSNYLSDIYLTSQKRCKINTDYYSYYGTSFVASVQWNLRWNDESRTFLGLYQLLLSSICPWISCFYVL